MSKAWLHDASNSNLFKQSYIKDFLDVSGDVYIRNGDLITTNDISTNGNIVCNALSLTVPFSSSGVNQDITDALNLKQNKLTAGSGITIVGTTINAESVDGGVNTVNSGIVSKSFVNDTLTGELYGLFGFDIGTNTSGDSLVVSEVGYDRPATVAELNKAGRLVSYDKNIRAGRVVVYERNGNNWVQKGNHILSAYQYTQSTGFSVAMNGDGNIIAFNTLSTKDVLIYQWSGTDWVQKGNAVSMATARFAGFSIVLNNSGNRFITSYFTTTNVDTPNVGVVYEYNNEINVWEQLGNDFGNEMHKMGSGTTSNIFGSLTHRRHNMSMSGDGSRVVYAYAPHGIVHIYDYNVITNNWDPNGTISSNDVITATGSVSQLGFSVSISKDGSTIIITAPTGNIPKTGFARVYSYNGGGNWITKGSQLNGEYADDEFGIDCAINNNGTIIVVGSGFIKTAYKTSYVKYYKFINYDWFLIETKYSDTTTSVLGYSVTMNDSGLIYFASEPSGIIGTGSLEPGWFSGGGRVNIYEPLDLLQITIDSYTNVLGNLSVTGNIYSDNMLLHTSDDRLKDNEKRIENALETLNKLKPVKYTKNNKIETGFIAQDVWYHAPELKYLVKTNSSNIIDISSSYTHETDLIAHGWSVEPAQLKYIGLIGHITKGIQELDILIEENRTKVNRLLDYL